MTETHEIENVLANLGAADLVTQTTEGLTSTFLPLLYVPATNQPGERLGEPLSGLNEGHSRFAGASLHGHLTRANSQWKTTLSPEALVIVHTVDGYISPNS